MRRAGKFAGLFAGPFGRMRRETDCSGCSGLLGQGAQTRLVWVS